MAVINTCTVTNQADANARHLVRRLRRQRPDLRIVVAGCSTAFREADYRALRESEEVDGVVPGHDPAAVARELPALAGSGAGSQAAVVPLERNARGTRAWLKIQDGCDRKCSFCATRIARGASVSRPPEEVVAEAALLARVHPELVITGIHIGHYGRDLEPNVTLAELCERLLERVPARLRLSSIEATEIDDRLVDLVVESGGGFAPHLHVPLQSGSDRVLRLMRRWHTRQAYRGRVLDIADRVGAMGLGADIIVGFPGEGEEEFEETRALVEELPFTYLHIFPYSVRDGTVAAVAPRIGSPETWRPPVRESSATWDSARAGSTRRLASGKWRIIVVEGRDDRVLGVTGDYLKVGLVGGAAPGARFSAPLGGSAGRLVAAALEAAVV